MMKFRAILIEPNPAKNTARGFEPSRPLETYTQTVAGAQKWAEEILRKSSPQSSVQFFEVSETLMSTWTREDLYPTSKKEKP